MKKCLISQFDVENNQIFVYNTSIDVSEMKANEVHIMEVSYKGLWKLLIDKDLKKKDLSVKAGISQSSVAKMSRGETVGLDILLKICEALDCDISDLVEAVPSKNDDSES